MSIYFLPRIVAYKGEADVWCNGPTPRGIILYSVVTPILCCFGLFGNSVSLMVLKRKELVGSVYTYLAVLACVDFGMSVVLLMGGISRGIMWQYGWITYDALIGPPLAGALNTVSVLAIIGLTIDRVIFLWNPVQCTKPMFCNPWVARRLMIGSILIAIVFNLPYCFIYTWENDHDLTTTDFFDSTFYKMFNWFTLFVFAVIPTIILLLGNGFLIMSLRKARKINKKSKKCRTKRCNKRDHTNLTITLVMIIVFFLITNIPENLVSRTAAINLLFQGDHDKANTEILENVRQICTILGAIDVNTNFIFYYTFCPAFCKALTSICKCKKRRRSKLQVNVFVLNPNRTNKSQDLTNIEDNSLNKNVQKVLEISRKSIESAFAINRGDNDNDECHQDCNYISPLQGEYVEMENEYTPPFSTILEESSSYSTNTMICNKNII